MDRDLAPRQGDEGAPDAWLVFESAARRGIAEITVGAVLDVRGSEPATDGRVQHPLP